MRQIEQEKIMVFSLGTTVDGIRRPRREELVEKVSGTNRRGFRADWSIRVRFFAPYIQYMFPFNFMILTIHNEICNVCLATAGALMETRCFTFFSTDTQKRQTHKKLETTNKMATKKRNSSRSFRLCPVQFAQSISENVKFMYNSCPVER